MNLSSWISNSFENKLAALKIKSFFIHPSFQSSSCPFAEFKTGQSYISKNLKGMMLYTVFAHFSRLKTREGSFQKALTPYLNSIRCFRSEKVCRRSGEKRDCAPSKFLHIRVTWTFPMGLGINKSRWILNYMLYWKVSYSLGISSWESKKFPIGEIDCYWSWL